MELRKDLADKHAFISFSRTDFFETARTFWHNGYYDISSIRDMDSRERDLFLAQIKKDHRGSNMLADLRLTLKIFAWFEPQTRLREAGHHFEEIDVDRRMR